MYLVTASEMREADRITIEEIGIPGQVLMENAGRGAFEVIFEELSRMTKPASSIKVGVLAGRGNNGGDGFVIARYLSERGVPVTVCLLSEKSKVQGEAAANLKLLDCLDISVAELPDIDAFNAHKSLIVHQDVWVDAILGTGLTSDVRGYFREVIEFINHLQKPVYSADIPSGLNSDTGQICGACIRAHATVTFAHAKTGHFQYPGKDYAGKLHIVDIGVPGKASRQVNPKQFLLTAETVRAGFQKRPSDAHKGHAGHLLVIAGSLGKTGAAAMTAMSAMRTGAGLVTLGAPVSLNSILESQVLEVMTCPLPESKPGILGNSACKAVMRQLPGKRCLALGPGLGADEDTAELVFSLLQKITVPAVIDADGLNILAKQPDILKQLQIPVILTPHPGEMSRLTGKPAADIRINRIQCAREFAKTYSVHVVLKGAATVIAHPNGEVFINPTGNPGMASGGMGDVLTGMIAGLLAQGYSPEFSCRAGVFVHGAAADDLADAKGPFGFLASDLMAQIPHTLKTLLIQPSLR